MVSRPPVPARRWLHLGLALAFIMAWTVAGRLQSPGGLASSPPAALAASGCSLDTSTVKHLIYIQFDNVHFTRDNPNVPSDLEQMPHLLNFMEGNGTLLTNHHTPLIAHTGTDILTSLTGVYPDRMGVPVSNSFRYFNPDGSTGSSPAFAYWTDTIPGSTTDTTPLMLSENGKNAPAPWVPFTRAGCNVGIAGMANMAFENTSADINTVFGANSPQAAEAKSNPDQAVADFEGIAVHCSLNQTLCSKANGGMPDLLPDEPLGYTGYNALFGHKYLAQAISPGAPLKDLSGNVIKDSAGNTGFPGFDGMEAAVSLGYAAAMQEHGIPVTYAYISDAHDNHATGKAFGPGEAGYVAALKSYDDAFAAFFSRLAADGIDQSNSLFVFTADEGDHFVGSPPIPTGCNGVTIPCTYSSVGYFNSNLTGLMATQQGITTPFTVHSDSAPTIYLTGNPAPDAQVTRSFEQGLAQIQVTNPLTGQLHNLTHFMADPVEEKNLHMVTADPRRTPTLTLFAYDDYFGITGPPNCNQPCVTVNPTTAWNHGDISDPINTTWLGLVGPGVRNLGADNAVWSDHTDIRPTIMSILGLKDDYTHDGRVLTEVLNPSGMSSTLAAHTAALQSLGEVYKRLDAPVNVFGYSTLSLSTFALASQSEPVYDFVEEVLHFWGTERDALVGQMRTVLENAEFNGQDTSDARINSLIAQGNDLLTQVNLAANEVP